VVARRRRSDAHERADSRTSSLKVGRAADPAEAQADRFADGLLHDLAVRPMSVQRAGGVAHDELGGTAVDAETESRIRSVSGGNPLPETLRRAAEERSGRDLARVRVHTGGDAADLSARLHATAFTVGTDVFLGADAARPGTSGGDALLGHELGHVVQQGGGIASRSIQRQSKLTPLRSSGSPVAQRLFGKKKSASDKVNETVERSKGSKIVTVRDLESQISMLESALSKLLKGHTRGNTATQSAAYGLKAAAERILGNLPDQGSKASKLLGRTYPAQVKRLQRIIDETQLIWDEHLVEMTRRKAGNIYSRAAVDAGSGRAGALTKLSGTARTTGFAPLGPRPDALGPDDDVHWSQTPEQVLAAKQAGYDFRKGLRDNGAALGLSPAEVGAIITFTAADYSYINPATANSRDWMIAANAAADKVDAPDKSGAEKIDLQLGLKARGITMDQRLDERKKELAQRTQEGALHAGMAMQGLLKLPVWKGQLFRGECVKRDDFEKRFRVGRNDKVTPLEKTIKRTTISSASKERQVAVAFQGIAANKVPDPKVMVLWVMDVTNGRDIETISAATKEREVATLPGAEFKIVSAEQVRPDSIVVKCRQRK
jgi:hypothetical protein